MTDVNMSASDILEHMKNGAELYRGFGDEIELRTADGVYLVPVDIFDALTNEDKIIADPHRSSFYRLKHHTG